MVVQFYKRCAKNVPVERVEFLAFLKTKDDVFGFQICVDDIANPVKVVESHQSLSGDLTDDGNRNTLVIVFFY